MLINSTRRMKEHTWLYACVQLYSPQEFDFYCKFLSFLLILKRIVFPLLLFVGVCWFVVCLLFVDVCWCLLFVVWCLKKIRPQKAYFSSAKVLVNDVHVVVYFFIYFYNHISFLLQFILNMMIIHMYAWVNIYISSSPNKYI